MSLIVPKFNTFQNIQSNVLTTRPVGAFGTAITSDNTNSYTLITNTTYDSYGLVLNINSGAVSAASPVHSFKLQITPTGVAPANNANYIVFDSNFSYVGTGGPQGTNLAYGGHWFFLPLFIPAGSDLHIFCTSDNSLRTLRAAAWLYQAPTRPDLIQYGTRGFIGGTGVTPGTTSEGAWTLLTTVPAGVDAAYFQASFQVDDTTMSALAYSIDIGISSDSGTTVEVVVDGAMAVTTTIEGSSLMNKPSAWKKVTAGIGIYGRCQCSGTPDSNVTIGVIGIY